MRRFFRSIALAMLAWLPLQAAALPLLVLHCAAQDIAGLAQAHDLDSPCHTHDASAAGDPAATDDGDATVKPPHSCCTHFSALPTTHVGTETAPTPFQVAAPALPQYSFFPEPNKRPPRA